MTDKILNLNDVDDQDFEVIKDVVEDWKQSGCAGVFTFITEDDINNNPNYLRDAFLKGSNNDIGDFAIKALAGLVIGVGGTLLVNKLIKTKKQEAVVQED